MAQQAGCNKAVSRVVAGGRAAGCRELVRACALLDAPTTARSARLEGRGSTELLRYRDTTKRPTSTRSPPSLIHTASRIGMHGPVS